MRRTRSITATVLLMAGTAYALALGCRDAPTAREAAICRDDKLAELDGNVTRRYVAELAELSTENAELIRQDQHAWLGWLDKVCPAHPVKHDTQLIECLTTHIKDRAGGLSVTKIADITLFSRCYYVYAAEKPQDMAALHDPGFGEGAFCWPQIDRPTPKQQPFNGRALAFVVDAAAKNASVEATGFTQMDVAGSEQSVDYAVTAANGGLIELTVESFFFGHGAAHPISMNRTFAWWLDEGRELSDADIFRTSGRWAATFVPLVIARLKENEDYAPYLAANVEPAVIDKIKLTQAWRVSKEGWSLCFDQYEIGPYVMGMPCAIFQWSELTPLLNPALKPETLPQLNPEP